MKLLFIIFFLFSINLYTQSSISGSVFYDEKKPLEGAQVENKSTNKTVLTDSEGRFEIFYIDEKDTLSVSREGFQKLVLIVSDLKKNKQVELFFDNTLDEVVIKKIKRSLQKSFTLTTNTTTMTSKELLKAACCNLSESFETNPSIDVNFSDAITGNKQIRMLGLTSPYILFTEENVSSMRGASQAFGLSFIPGTWIESIQITKGSGSVINGFESISGQINYELIKPQTDIPFFLNAYASTEGRYELNTHFNKKINDKWATSLFVHGNARIMMNDMNRDGFLDNPLGKQLNVLNRWQYGDCGKGLVSFLSLRVMRDEKQGGEVHFDPKKDKLTTNHWGSEINTDKIDFTSKLGYVFPEMPFQSIGFQNAVQYHKQDSYFGLTPYLIEQKSWNSNLIFNSIISNTKNKFSTGLNFILDAIDERVSQKNWDRNDTNFGAFFEYTYDNSDNLSFIIGSRIDKHNRLGTFFSPRVHFRYEPVKKSVIRFSAGRGKRIANIFTENQQLFATSRLFLIQGNENNAYNLSPEIAWNYGVSFLQEFTLFSKKAEISFDFYRTDFQNQVVVDLDFNPQQVLWYNLDGKSFANSLQIDFNLDFSQHFYLRTTYKYFDVKTTYANNGLLQKPLQPNHRVFLNIAYETHVKKNGKQWKFDYTLNFTGNQRLPNSDSNPENFRWNEKAPSFFLMNTQVTKTFSKKFEAYLGFENLTNYRQPNAIISNQNPFGPFFDSSLIYGPVFGTMIYTGIRFKT